LPVGNSKARVVRRLTLKQRLRAYRIGCLRNGVAGMLGAFGDSILEHDWRLLAFTAVCLAACIIAIALYRRSRVQNAELVAALNTMSEGLCMFDASARLLLCNGRYIEMYGLTPEGARPGASLRELLDQRQRTGTFAGDPQQYIADALNRI